MKANNSVIEQIVEALVTIRHKAATGILFVGFSAGFFIGLVAIFFAHESYLCNDSIAIIVIGVLAGFIVAAGVVIRDLNVPLLFQVTDMFYVVVSTTFRYSCNSFHSCLNSC